MAEDPISVSAWRQIFPSMSSRHETSSAWHGCRECSCMHSMEAEALVSPQGNCSIVLNHRYSVVSFQDMIISGLQPETSYSLTVTAYTTKGDGARSKPNLVSTTGAGNHVYAYTCLQYVSGNNDNFHSGMDGFYQRGEWTVVNFCDFWYILS